MNHSPLNSSLVCGQVVAFFSFSDAFLGWLLRHLSGLSLAPSECSALKATVKLACQYKEANPLLISKTKGIKAIKINKTL